LQEVVVTAGLIIQKETVPVSEKIERRMDDWTTGLFRKKEMTVYPNPQVPGGSVNISINVKEVGDYIMEILDEEGRIVHRQQLEIHSRKETVSINTLESWSKGVYWVRLTGKNLKNTVHSKLMLR
jgi:N-methylhydantoinase B/oxoprolinase/acetone carboxylase alpha subunit